MDKKINLKNLKECIKLIEDSLTKIEEDISMTNQISDNKLSNIKTSLGRLYSSLKSDLEKIKSSLNTLGTYVTSSEDFSKVTFVKTELNKNTIVAGNFNTTVFSNTSNAYIINPAQNEHDIKMMLQNDASLNTLVAAVASGAAIPATTTDKTWRNYANYYIKSKELATGRPIPPKTEQEMNDLVSWLKKTNGGKVAANNIQQQQLASKIVEKTNDSNMRNMIKEVGTSMNSKRRCTTSYSDDEWKSYAEYYIYDKAYRTGTSLESMYVNTTWEQKVTDVANWLKRDYGKN